MTATFLILQLFHQPVHKVQLATGILTKKHFYIGL